MPRASTCFVVITASVVMHAVLTAAATTDDPTTFTAFNCTGLGLGPVLMQEYDKLASHTKKHEFTAGERASADSFVTHYDSQVDLAAEKKELVGGDKNVAPSAACTALYDAMKISIKEAKNGAARKPVAHALMALLSLAAMAHMSEHF